MLQRPEEETTKAPVARSAQGFPASCGSQGGVSEGLYQIVQLRVITEEGLVLLLLLVDEVLDVHVEAGRGDALGALSGLLALLKQQSQEREQRVPAGQSSSGPYLSAPLLRMANPTHLRGPCSAQSSCRGV